MKKFKLPADVLALCEIIAKGYERRRKDYERKRLDIIYSGGNGGIIEINSSAGNANGLKASSVEIKTERLERLEASLDAKFLRAVEQSLSTAGSDVSRDSRERLQKALLLNLEDGREYPFEILGIDEFSRRDFYRRRRKFVETIAVMLGLIDCED